MVPAGGMRAKEQNLTRNSNVEVLLASAPCRINSGEGIVQNLGNVKPQIVEALSTVLDPELGVDIVALGLVYGLQIQDNDLRVVMTMTTPACPLNSYFTQNIERTIRRRIPNILHCEVDIVWQPQWDPSMMSEEGKLQMGWR